MTFSIAVRAIAFRPLGLRTLFVGRKTGCGATATTKHKVAIKTVSFIPIPYHNVTILTSQDTITQGNPYELTRINPPRVAL